MSTAHLNYHDEYMTLPALGTAVRQLGLAVVAQATTIVPLVLLGTMAVGIRRDLGFDESSLGALIAFCFAAAAVLSLVSGGIVDALGAGRGVALAALATAAGTGALAVADGWPSTLLPLALLGLGVAVVQPATDVLIAEQVPVARHGIAFGLKQAAGGPAIGLLGGLAVPLMAGTLGWRASFGIAGGVSLLVAVTAGRRPRGRRGRHPRLPHASAPLLVPAAMPFRPLRVLALAGFAGSAAQCAFVSFAVSAAVASGMSEGRAGLLFAAGSAIGGFVRIAGGHLADRRAGGLLLAIAAMMGLGVAGFGLLALERPAAVALAVPLLCGTTWGWQGLYFLAIARISPAAAARASGMGAAGLLTGGVLGPLAFGVLASRDYGLAWGAAAAASVLAGCLVLSCRQLLQAVPAPLAAT